MSDQEKPDNAQFSAAGPFRVASGFIRKNKAQTTTILTSVLLGTTALATPLLASTITAGALLLGACYLLAKSSDALVDHAAAIGKKKSLSPLLIGLGLGALTSMPELFVSVGSVLKGMPELGIGNIVGSNIANILLILGVTAGISSIAKGRGLCWKFNNYAMMGTAAAFAGLLATGTLSPIAGVGLLGLGAAYMVSSYKISKKDMNAGVPSDTGANTEQNNMYHPDKMPIWFNSAWGIAGLGGLICSADLMINSASRFASGLGVSQSLIGALAVAVGTSLPELVVNVKAALKKETDMALGNILGSNVFNILVVGGAVALGKAAVPSAFSFSSTQGLLNMGAFGASAVMLGALLHKGGGALKRWHGWVGVSLYAAFVAASIHIDAQEKPDHQPITIVHKADAILRTAP